MSVTLRIERAGALATVQDEGRPGLRGHGISASGPMDRIGYALAGSILGQAGCAIEFSSQGLTLAVSGGSVRFGAAGGTFRVRHNGTERDWPAAGALRPGDTLDIATGSHGNFGYLRFDREIDVPVVLGSRATNVTVGLGGNSGRALCAGDVLNLVLADLAVCESRPESAPSDAPFRFIWGVHAGHFARNVRAAFCTSAFAISSRMDRMGMRLDDRAKVFGGTSDLSLVSEAIVPGDIQILGDGTPTVLMRDHQPTGGYPRIATVIGADLDRLAQTRPGSLVRFQPVTVETAHAISRGGRA